MYRIFNRSGHQQAARRNVEDLFPVAPPSGLGPAGNREAAADVEPWKIREVDFKGPAFVGLIKQPFAVGRKLTSLERGGRELKYSPGQLTAQRETETAFCCSNPVIGRQSPAVDGKASDI